MINQALKNLMTRTFSRKWICHSRPLYGHSSYPWIPRFLSVAIKALSVLTPAAVISISL
jgi:hypothetical protein